jgi:molecular chaperone DnaJ
MAVQTEWLEKDYYKVLGVPETATDKEITRAYRKLARQLHPDANPDNPPAEERFKAVSAAYDVLGDAEKRKEYDEIRRLGPRTFGAGPAGPGGFTFRVDDLGGRVDGLGSLGDIGDLFGDDLLGGLFGGGRRGSRAPRGQRGRDLEDELHLSFEDAIRGTTTSVKVTSEVPCATCGGSGARPDTSPTVCSQCGGRGVLDEDQGLFSFSRPCSRCGGRGHIVEDPCPTCGGSGTELRARDVKVRVPAGVEDGQTIRVKGRGGPGSGGARPGDLFVRVRVAPHPLFGRRGRDLTLTVPITFVEAALGADVKVPTLEGAPVTVRVPPGTPSGRTFRLRGRGISTPKGTGDLLVSVEIAVPKRVSAPEREALEALAAASTDSPRSHLGV